MNIEGHAVPPARLNRMARDLAVYSPDAQHSYCTGNIGMLHAALWLTNEDTFQEQPMVSRDGVCLVCDARIDNRVELARELANESGLAALSDAALMLDAYLRWGTKCLQHIVGDFAMVVWDPRERRLFCACDAIGVKQLFYSLDGNTFAWASRVRVLAGLSPQAGALDSEYVANYLIRGPLPLEFTPYNSIKKLVPGEYILIEGGRLSRTRYWAPDPRTELKYSSDGEYEEHFRQLLGESIRARMRSRGTVWFELSGGLDSSSLVGCALDAVRKSSGTLKPPETLSYVYQTAYKSDEKVWIDHVSRHCGLPGHRICLDPADDADFSQDEFYHWDQPTWAMVYSSQLRRVKDLLAQHKVRVLIGGNGGDHLLIQHAPPLYIGDLLRHFQWRTAWYELDRWQQHQKLPLLNLLFDTWIAPLFSRSDQVPPTERFRMPMLVPGWLDRSFAKKMAASRRPLLRLAPKQCDSAAFQWRYERLLEASEHVNRGFVENITEFRYPFLDRRVVEFLMATPWQQLLRPGESRSLLRRMIAGMIPDNVRMRQDKSGPGHAIYLAIQKQWPSFERMLRNPIICEYGFVDRTAFRGAMNLARHGSCTDLPSLMSALALEIWLRNTYEAPTVQSRAV